MKAIKIDQVPYTEIGDILGMPIVGYRYGEAPEEGRSYNYRDHEFEPGVSLAQWGQIPEIWSFAISDVSHKKKRYYKGVIAGTGGDDEVCIKKYKEITYKEYLKLRKELYASSIAYLDYRISRLRYLVSAGYSPADYMSQKADKFEELRRKIIKKFNK
jgi:hypothetical protein|nr:MAG TPA: hypothetical protein [Caudoviricetes sp.]